MYVYVNLNSFVLAFRSYDINRDAWSWVGFNNFKQLFYDISTLPQLRNGLKNSLLFFIISLPFTLVSLMFAYYIFKRSFVWKFFRVTLFLPSIVSGAVLYIMIRYYAELPLTMLYNAIFNQEIVGLLSNKSTLIGTLIFFSIFLGFGTNVLIYTSCFDSVDKSVLEAARIDGANELVELFVILIPQAIGTIGVFVTVSVAGIFTNQAGLFMLYASNAPDSAYTIGYYLYREVLRASSDAAYPKIAALGLCITIITTPTVFGVRTLMNKLDPMLGE